MDKLLPLIMIAIFATGCEKQAATPQSQLQIPSVADAAPTPTTTVQAFFIAMLSSDETEIRKHILSNPNASVLWQGQAPPPEVLSVMRAQFDTMTIRECVVGESLDLPRGRQLIVTDQMVNVNNKLVYPVVGGESMPTPLPLVKVEDQWKVDAGSLIAARQAANQVRRSQ